MMIRSILSNWMALVVTAVVSIVLTPILIHGLGHLHYGIWILVGSLVDSFGLLDVGIRTSLQRFVARLDAAGDRRALNETFATGIALTLAVCVLVLVASVVLFTLPPHVFGLDDAEQWLFHWLTLLLGTSVSVTVLARFLGAYLCGLQRFDLYNLAAIVSTLVRAVIIVVALRMGGGAVWVGGATLASAAVLWALHWYFVRRLDRRLRFGFALVKVARARELVSFSAYIFLITAADYLRTYSAPVIIARTLGVALITPFSIAVRLMDYFRSIVLGVIGPLMPRMSALHGQGRQVDLQSLMLRSVRITALLASFMAWSLVLSGDELIRVWLGPGFEISVSLTLILLVGIFLAQIQSPGGPLLIASARHGAYAWWILGEALATVLLSIYWTQAYGLPGAALAMTVPRVVVKLTIQPWYVLRVSGLSFKRCFHEALLRPLVVNALFFAVCLATNAFAPSSGLPALLWALTWQTAVFLALIYTIGLTSTSRQRLREIIRRADAPEDPIAPDAIPPAAPLYAARGPRR